MLEHREHRRERRRIAEVEVEPIPRARPYEEPAPVPKPSSNENCVHVIEPVKSMFTNDGVNRYSVVPPEFASLNSKSSGNVFFMK